VEFTRTLNLLELSNKKSFFLFGPRSTGKTHLMRRQLQGKAVWIDLLKSETFMRLTQNPTDIEDMFRPFHAS
jgi:AAA+ ATPase superfamily predicted ATPase